MKKEELFLKNILFRKGFTLFFFKYTTSLPLWNVFKCNKIENWILESFKTENYIVNSK